MDFMILKYIMIADKINHVASQFEGPSQIFIAPFFLEPLVHHGFQIQ